ncbi:MAG: Hsp20/alpha crystallin family protein [Bdellovibrionales bacterium]|nr:Hsp20/alpha crystallin family protein [Bdellovibrionales bacterium]
MNMLSPFFNDLSWARRRLSPSYFGDDATSFEKVFDNFFQNEDLMSKGFRPSCDISEANDHYLLSVDLPGVKKEDVRVDAINQRLTVSGERRYNEKYETGDKSTRHERFYGAFERSFLLPNNVDVEKIEAHYEDGVLRVAIPKASIQRGKSIKIQSGEESFFSKLLGNTKTTSEDVKVNNK